MVFFEAPHRLADSLTALATGLGGDRAAAICRELTKTYEETLRGSLTELAQWATGQVRGEITLVVAGASADEVRQASGLVTPADWTQAVARLVANGSDRKEAIAAIAREAGVPKREVYDAVVKGPAQSR
jgi:16S rRNA (cytidine1402-2'-O)-methyltransferase